VADPFAALLVEEGLLSEEGLAAAQARQHELGGGLDSAILELGLATDEAICAALSRATGLPVAPGPPLEPDARARRVFPSKVAERHGLAPFRMDGRELAVLAAYPVDQASIDEIGFMLSLDVAPFACTEWRVAEVRRRLYGSPLPERFAALAAREEARRAAVAPSLPPERFAAPMGDGDPAETEPAPPAEPEAAPAFAAPSPAAEIPEAAAGPLVAAPAEPDPAAPPAPAIGAALSPPPPGPSTAGRAPAPSPALTAAQRSRPPRWDLATAREALEAAPTRDAVVTAALRYARDFFEAAALFAVTRERLQGHDALGEDPQIRARVRGIAVPAGLSGVLRAVLDAGGPYLGPAVHDPALDAVLAGLGRGAPRTVLLYPIVVVGRVACVLYADNGEAPVSPSRVGDLLLFASTVGAALERLLRSAKARERSRPPAEWEAREPAASPPPPPAAVEVDLGEYEVAPASQALSAALAFDPVEAAERLAQSARGSAERGRLVALLVQHGPEAAAALVRDFPGPIDSRIAGREEGLPVDERGPVLLALAALGIVATPWVGAILADPDPRRRRYAALLLGQIGDPASFLPLADRVFDPDPEVAAAALEALGGLRRHPDFAPVRAKLRRALGGESPRPEHAARALVQLGDAGAVPQLVALLAGAPGSAAAAAEALVALTARPFGRDAAAWSSWWNEHRGRSRTRWLFEGLADPSREVRLAAAEALRAVAPPPVRYFADAPEAERSEAAETWRAWFDGRGLEA